MPTHSANIIAKSPTHITVLLVIAFLLLVLSMIFSAAESAFLSINRLRVRFLKEKGHKGAKRTSLLLKNKEKLINTLLVANNIVNISLSAIVTTVTVEVFGALGVAIATTTVTVALLLFGEITPKTIAQRHAEPVAFLFSFFILIIQKILSPIVWAFTFVSRFFLSLFGFKQKQAPQKFTQEEIKTFIDVGQETGAIQSSQKQLMQSVFKFTDLQAKDIMVPRKKIIAIDTNTTYSEVLSIARKTKLSRFPVFRGDIDHIEGLLYLKDLLLIKDEKTFMPTDYMRPPLFILETKKMSLIQQILKDNHQSMAVVVDEYAGTEGVLTSQDIQREIFGTITQDALSDYNDYNIEDTENETFEKQIAGSARLLDIEDSLKLHFNSPDCETIAGFIAQKLDRMPEVGDKVEFCGFDFAVTKMEGLSVANVLVTLANATPSPTEQKQIQKQTQKTAQTQEGLNMQTKNGGEK